MRKGVKPAVVGDKVASRIPAGVLCFKSSLVPLPWRLTKTGFREVVKTDHSSVPDEPCETCRFKSPRVYIYKYNIKIKN
jgi:hypothetical protein